MSSLIPIFRDKLLPWAQDSLEDRLIVARPKMKRADVPYGVELTPKQIAGKRKLVRGPRYSGYRICHAQWPQAGLHELEMAKMVCVIKGTTDFIVGDYYVTCNEGHFILLPPRTPNSIGSRSHLEGENRRNGYCELLQIRAERDEMAISYSRSRGEEHEEIRDNNCTFYHRQAARLFDEFVADAIETGCNGLQFQGHMLSACFLLLQRELAAGREIHHRPRPSNSPKNINAAEEIRAYIKTHLEHPLTIEKMAQHMYMSPRQFTRYVRRETGHTFVEIYTECRIEEAKRLLQETPWSVAGIAVFLGFKSVTYFNTFFVRNVGCTPGVFRKKNVSLQK